MSTHNLCFLSRNKKIMYTPVNPSFTIEKWGLRGSTLYRHVFVMWALIVRPLTVALDTVEYIDKSQMSLSGCAASLAHLKLSCVHMPRRHIFLSTTQWKWFIRHLNYLYFI